MSTSPELDRIFRAQADKLILGVRDSSMKPGGTPYSMPKGTMVGDVERAQVAARGLYLRLLVLFRRQCRRVGLFRR